MRTIINMTMSELSNFIERLNNDWKKYYNGVRVPQSKLYRELSAICEMTTRVVKAGNVTPRVDKAVNS